MVKDMCHDFIWRVNALSANLDFCNISRKRQRKLLPVIGAVSKSAMRGSRIPDMPLAKPSCGANATKDQMVFVREL